MFSAVLNIPATFTAGPATLTADCGTGGTVLSYVILLEGGTTPIANPVTPGIVTGVVTYPVGGVNAGYGPTGRGSGALASALAGLGLVSIFAARKLEA